MAEALTFPLEALFPLLGCESVSATARRVVTDTRQLQAGDLFVAITGARFDGHDFVAQAAQQGAVGAVVTRRQPVALPQCQVADTRRAYGRIAQWHRRRMPLRALVAVTGSNGKTSTKEMLAAVLSEVAPTHATRGNLNNDLGVPATLLGLEPAHRYAVVEMGANHVGEIAWLGEVAEPDLGVITQAAEAHVGEFGSLANIIAAKGELIDALPKGGVVVLNRDSAGFEAWRTRAAQRGVEVVTFGQDAQAQVRLLEVVQTPAGVRVTLEDLHGVERELTLPVWGRHQAWNAAAAVAAAQALTVDWAAIETGLRRFSGAPGRMQPVALRGGGVLVDDSYNANPASVKAAVESLISLGVPVWVCLGPLEELGEAETEQLAGLGTWMREQGVVGLWGLGERLLPAVNAFGEGAQIFMDHEAMARALARKLRHCSDLNVLVKGSRSAAMEQLIQRLREHHADLFV